MGSLSIWHWAIVVLVLVLLFGSKRLPDATRNLGRSLRILKSEVKEMQQDGPAAPTAQQQYTQPQYPAAPAFPAPTELPQGPLPHPAAGWSTVPQPAPGQPVDAVPPTQHIPPQAV